MSETELAYHVARWMTCGIWFGAGIFKLFHFNGFASKMAHYNFPMPAFVAAGVIAVELVGTTLLVLNLLVWAVALVWIGFTVWATWIEHRHCVDKGCIIFPEWVQVWKNVSIIGGLVLLILLDTARPEWLL